MYGRSRGREWVSGKKAFEGLESVIFKWRGWGGPLEGGKGPQLSCLVVVLLSSLSLLDSIR